MNGPTVPIPPVVTMTITTALLNVGPGSNPAAYVPNPGRIGNFPDATKGNVAGVWGYIGPLGEAPSQTSQPPITCAVYGQGGIVGVNQGFKGTIEDSDASGDGVIGFGNAHGVHGIGTRGTGVAGTSTDGSGVAGSSENGIGVKGISTNGVGIAGESKSTASAGGPAGIFGTSSGGDGVHGESQSSNDSGVAGINNGGGHGVFGRSKGGEGVHGESIGGYGVYATSDKTAGYFQGDVTVTGKLTAQGDVGVTGKLTAQGDVGVNGTLTAKVDVVLGSDCAEDFDIAPSAETDPGTVMVLTDNGAVQPSQNAYDKKVAGVISGAGDYRPGLILGRCDSLQERMPLALVGKVYCKVDADPAPIAVGDLLTTSARPGFGMKATDSAQAFGAVIGKALKPLRAGQGMIPILVALQ